MSGGNGGLQNAYFSEKSQKKAFSCTENLIIHFRKISILFLDFQDLPPIGISTISLEGGRALARAQPTNHFSCAERRPYFDHKKTETSEREGQLFLKIGGIVRKLFFKRPHFLYNLDFLKLFEKKTKVVEEVILTLLLLLIR